MSLLDKVKNLFRFKKPKTVETPAIEVEEKSKGLIPKILQRFIKNRKSKKKIKITPVTSETPPITNVQSVENLRKEFYEKHPKKKMNVPEEPLPIKSDIILQELERRISTWEADGNAALSAQLHGDYSVAERAGRLRETLYEEINTYGRAKVAYACEQAGHTIISNAAVYVFDSDDQQRHIALTMFMMLLRGEVLSPDDAKNIGEELETTDDYNPFEDEE